jgi:hypothetical protein
MSTFSATLWTARITTGPLVAVAVGGTRVGVDVGIGVSVGIGVAVGIGVSVGVGATEVSVGDSVGGGVSVGNALGTDKVKVAIGVNVGKSKSNKAVGVTCVPSVGIIVELGTTFGGLLRGNRLVRREHRQQNINSNKTGKRILPVCPCWL